MPADPLPTPDDSPGLAPEAEPTGFAKYRRKAEALAQKPARVREMLVGVTEKFEAHRENLGQLRYDLPGLLRLVRAWVRGDYRRVPLKSIALVIGGLLYFLTPLDVIPDFIPVVGFLDDAAVIAYVLRSIRADVERFEEWEARR